MSKFLTSEVSSTVGYKLLCSYLTMSLTKSSFCGFFCGFFNIISSIYIQVFLLAISCHIQIKMFESFFLCLSLLQHISIAAIHIMYLHAWSNIY